MSVTRLARSGVAVALAAAYLFSVASSASAVPALDTAFGGGSIAPEVFPGGKWLQTATDVALQPDGKVVVPMSISGKYHHTRQSPVIRYNPDGSRDATYGADGVAWVKLPGYKYAAIAGVSVQLDGRALVNGLMWNASGGVYKYFVARLTTQGRLDRSFAKKGFIAFSAGRQVEVGLVSTAQLPSADIVVPLIKTIEDGKVLEIRRYSPSGRTRTRFGTNGKLTLKLEKHAWFLEVNDFQLAGDQAWVLFRPDSEDTSPCTIMHVKLGGHGRLDKNFGKGGRVAFGSGIPKVGMSCSSIAPTSDGGAVVTGALYPGPSVEWASGGKLIKITAAGALDPLFGGGGAIARGGDVEYTGVAQNAVGEYLALGYRSPENLDRPDTGIAGAYSGSGGFLGDLGPGGVLPYTFGGYSDGLDHAGGATVGLYTQFNSRNLLGTRIVRFTD